MNLNSKSEPILLPAALATLLVVVAIPVGVAWLTDLPVKAALATALLSLAPLLIANTRSRKRVHTSRTVAELTAAAYDRGHVEGIATVLAPKPVKKATKKAPAKKVAARPSRPS
jgi:membrane protein implicated in regulation of membrane protease activity